MWLWFAASVGIFLIAGLVGTGSLSESAAIVVRLSPFILLSCYFATRNKAEAPSRAERVIARSWLIVRRVVCFVGAASFGGAGVFAIRQSVVHGSGGELVGGLLAVCVAAACIWWGIYGSVRKYSFREDRPTHEERKRRYGWK